MAKKEVKIDLWVARQLDSCNIDYDAQGSDVKEINEALQTASKRGTGNAGYPEYVAVIKDFVIVIEDKADLSKHEKLTDKGIISTRQKDVADCAVNGAYFYSKHIAQNSNFCRIFQQRFNPVVCINSHNSRFLRLKHRFLTHYKTSRSDAC